jgi:hypothetical protein
MSQVVSGVTEKLQDLLPGQIGANSRWTTTDVERHIMMADRAVRERIGNLLHRQEITLLADTSEYTLDSEFIDIVSVEFASDGSTYDEYLQPITLNDLDKINLGWRDDGGTRPEFYTVLSAPGLPTAKLLVYRPMSSVDAQTLRVTGYGIGSTTTDCPDDVQDKCHVPYVMAILLAQEDARAAAEWFGQYLGGCDEMRRRFRSRYSGGTVRTEFGW